MIRSAIVLVLAVALSLLMLHDRSPHAGAATVPTKKVAIVDVPGQTEGVFAYVPRTITVHAGTKVVWRNTSSQPHSVTSTAATPVFDSGSSYEKLIMPGHKWSHVFKKPGTYPYYCAIHPDMKGKVVVVP